ncbi:hypothetical protein H5410_003788 [Solanum commersonii]|uniref:HAT C-terminal dimerisation domain-containing protein n=1 Tax=Solanum commersonii TaxID=4109 RepID=A0A9J6B6M1_SOLCO|nr:hypothetical protein H5410_003788 [Solanum commersonii]
MDERDKAIKYLNLAEHLRFHSLFCNIFIDNFKNLMIFLMRWIQICSMELLLHCCVPNVVERFSDLNGLYDLSKRLVQTKKHSNYPLVFHLVKLGLLLLVATVSIECAFSAMKLSRMTCVVK